MTTIGLRSLAIVVVPIIRKGNAAPTLTSRRVPASSNIGVGTESSTREETVAAEGVLVRTGCRFDLGALRVEEHVAVEITGATFSLASCAALVGEGHAFALKDELGVAGLITWVAADEGVRVWDCGGCGETDSCG